MAARSCKLAPPLPTPPNAARSSVAEPSKCSNARLPSAPGNCECFKTPPPSTILNAECFFARTPCYKKSASSENRRAFANFEQSTPKNFAAPTFFGTPFPARGAVALLSTRRSPAHGAAAFLTARGFPARSRRDFSVAVACFDANRAILFPEVRLTEIASAQSKVTSNWETELPMDVLNAQRMDDFQSSNLYVVHDAEKILRDCDFYRGEHAA